jgi:hypothetical protein
MGGMDLLNLWDRVCVEQAFARAVYKKKFLSMVWVRWIPAALKSLVW